MMTLPIFSEIEIETISACNRTCWHCKFGIDKSFPRGRRMPTAMIARIIDQLAEIEYSGQINWYSTNEPLLDKRIFTILEAASNKVPRAKQFLVTNGDLLTQTALDKLFQAGLDLLYVSCYDDSAIERIGQLQIPRDAVVITLDHRTPTKIPGFFNRGGAVEELSNEVNSYINQYCHFPNFQLALASDGSLKLCCADMYGEAFIDPPNISKHTLLDLWSHHELTIIREELKRAGRTNINICRHCNFNSALRWPTESANNLLWRATNGIKAGKAESS